MNRLKVAIWAGMISPVLFIGIFMLEGLFHPEYDPITMYVSELSLGSRGWIQIVNFMVSGVLFLLFAIGIIPEFRESKASYLGSVFLVIFGICLFLSGPFVMDPTSTSHLQMSLHGFIHQILGAIAFLVAPISCFMFMRRFQKNSKFQSLKSWTLVVGIMISIAVVVMRLATTEPPVLIIKWIELIQRLVLIPYLIWSFTFTLKIHENF